MYYFCRTCMPSGSFTSDMQVLVVLVLVVGRDSLAWGGMGGNCRGVSGGAE